VLWLIEVKTSDADPSGGLRYYTERLKPKQSVQLVLNLDRPQERGGIKVLPLGPWLQALSAD
jgi:hypothetical protein